MNQNMIVIAYPTKQIAAVCEALKRARMNVRQTEDVDSIKAELVLHSSAFLLLDLDITGAGHFLSEISGIILRPRPFILVSALFSNSTERAAALRLGADVCVGKPIEADEVLAVIYAVLRRERWIVIHSRSKRLPCVEYKDLFIDPFHRLVTMCDVPICLTAKEFDILYLLVQHIGIVLTKEEIYRTIWNEDMDLKAPIITDHISSIRKKLGLSRKDTDYIQTVFGIGYRFGISQ